MQTTLAVLLLAFFSWLPVATASTYYIDCSAGSDGAAGSSTLTAWRTLARLAATTFSPGDSILLKRSTRCVGQLSPKGSGEPERPIRVGAYGSGALPVIDAGNADAAIKLFNQRHWVIEALETTGGHPYGVFVSGTQGELRGFVLKDLVVHDVTGEPKSKVTGLVVFAAPEEAQMADLLIDGITAYNTTEWAGIIVNGTSREHRVRNVVIRNSIVHHVYGDGIVMFSVEDGLIERSAAWLTGLQPEEHIGTPNAIWTWTCRRCTVRQTEGFFIDSPGVDGGVYDIDFGNDDNVVEESYGHDAMGYCAAVFAAEKQITTNSIIRGNLCIDNGRSPKLARRQGDMFISTWEGGLLDGVRIENNTFYWSPLIDVPAVMMDHAEFTGTRPNIVTGNRIYTGVSTPIHSSDALKFERNTVGPSRYTVTAASAQSGRFRLVLTGADRGQGIFLQTALAQYPNSLEALLIVPDPSGDLANDWNLGRVQLITGSGPPGLQLFAPDGKALAQWSGFVSPGELGLALRHNLGVPAPFGAEVISPEYR
jgi:hypothetical protein